MYKFVLSIFDIAAELGTNCTNEEECLAHNAQCTSGVCACKTIYDLESRRCETSKSLVVH